MSGKIAWYLRDNARDPYVRERAAIKRTLGTLSRKRADEWYALKESYEFFDGEVEIELSVLRRFVKEGGRK